MAEVGTLIAIIQITDRVIELCRYWIETAHNARSDLRSILLETSMLRTIFTNIEFLEGCNGVSSAVVASLTQHDGPIEHCRKILSDLEGLLPPDVTRVSGKKRMRQMAASLAWPLKAPKAQRLLQELLRYKTAISLALVTESSQTTKEIKADTSKMLDMLSDRQRNDIYTWLQQTDPSMLYNRAERQIEDGTCSWMLRQPEWTDWLAAKHRFLWIHGIPGAGKTVLASYLIRELKRHCNIPGQANTTVLYYYCYFGHNQDEAAPFLRWAVTQLCRQTGGIPAYVYDLFKQGCEPRLAELLESLHLCLGSFETVYIVLDAVDESKPRDDLLKVLRDLATDPRFGKLQLLATSGEYIDIETVFEPISTPISMLNPSVVNDIRCYVRSVLQTKTRFRRWSPQLLVEVEDTLSTRAKGMFRWAVCQLDRLHRLRDEAQTIRHALNTLPKTLDETYERIFLEIMEDERAWVRQCLKWIDTHNILYDRNIPCSILLQALGQGEYNSSPTSNERLINNETLREACGCLISISPGQAFNLAEDEDNQGAEPVEVVSFAHYTVREYLSSDRMSMSSAAYFLLEGSGIEIDTLRQLLSIASSRHQPDIDDDSLNGSSDSPELVLNDLLSSDFYSYCTISAGICIRNYSSVIADHPDLCNSVFKLVDPSENCSQRFMNLMRFAKGGFDSLDQLPDDWEWKSLRWMFQPSSVTQNHAMRLFRILIIAGVESGLAGKWLAKAGPPEPLVHEPLKFEIESFYNYDVSRFDCPIALFFHRTRDTRNFGVHTIHS